MIPSLTLLLAVASAAPAPNTDSLTGLWQVAPDTSEKQWTAPTTPSSKERAVVLIHGLFVHPIRPAKAMQAWCRDWQEPKSEMVKALAKDSDVFAFAYSQTAPLDEVADSVGMRDSVTRLHKAGYKEIVLIGHSAGGVIARQFVERYPDAGVTKVIAVAAPFAGADAATFKVGYPKAQAPFVQSLTPEARAEAMKTNKHALGKDVQIVCVVCKLKHVETDGLVGTTSQWPDDLQRLGVPIVHSPTTHFTIMYTPSAVKTITELAREKLTRWSPEEVEKARKILLGEK